MKTVFHVCLFAGLFSLAAFPANAMENPSPEQLEARLRDLGLAPRLFASAADWAALPKRLESDPVAAAIYRETRHRADALLAGPLLEHKMIGSRRLTSARLLIGRVIDLATVARVEKDSRFATRAREELLATAALPDWGPHHFLDNAEYALAVSIGLDWLHDALSPADRDVLAKALIEKSIRLTFDREDPSLWWLKSKNNWAQVCHAGLTAAALAIADREPALAARTIARAIASQAGPNEAYAPDGAYPEGPGYWNYGTTFEVILISLLDHALGSDYGLADAPGFLASADYVTQMTGPTGRLFNYADSRDKIGTSPLLHWFAARRDQPGVAAPALAYLAELPPAETSPGGNDRFNALALWWRKLPPTNAALPATRTLPASWLGRGENPVAVFRSAWNDPRATFVGIKGGTASSSHAHMDAGSFILEADGVRWAVDTGMQDYTAVEAAKVSLWTMTQDSGRWGVFRIGPEAHNILRFDGGRQLVKGMARFVNFSADAPAPTATVDLSPLYADRAASVRRRVSLLPDHRVLFEDAWTTGDQPTKVTWQWLTFAGVTLVGDRTVLLKQDGATLRLRVLSPGTVKIEDEDVSNLRKPYEDANPGLRRVRIVTETATGALGSLAVIAEPGSVLAGGDLPDPALVAIAVKKPSSPPPLSSQPVRHRYEPREAFPDH